MNLNDLIDWKRHPVTQAVFSTLNARIDDLTERLVENAGNDPLKDARFSGAILAHRDILNIAYDDISNEEETQ